MKSTLKEIFLILLLCCIIFLIIGAVFYNYIPTSKVVPTTVEAYKTSDTIKNEISQEVVDYPKQNVIFEVTDSDLSLYKQGDSYDAGKANPFESEEELANSTLNEILNDNFNSTDHFFNSSGLK